MKIKFACAILLSLAFAREASAHHSFAMFDNQKQVTVEGVVKDYQWTNPHTWLQLLVKDPATGKTVEWSIEGSSPNSLMRMGWKRTTLKPGDKVEISVHPLKDGTAGGSLVGGTVNGQVIGKPSD